MKTTTKRKTPHLTDSLNRSLPMAVNSLGISMVFRRNLSPKEVCKAFDLFHLAASIETPNGYYTREKYMGADSVGEPTSVARGIYDGIRALTRCSVKAEDVVA